jgi:hypothetical protein
MTKIRHEKIQKAGAGRSNHDHILSELPRYLILVSPSRDPKFSLSDLFMLKESIHRCILASWKL